MNDGVEIRYVGEMRELSVSQGDIRASTSRSLRNTLTKDTDTKSWSVLIGWWRFWPVFIPQKIHKSQSIYHSVSSVRSPSTRAKHAALRINCDHLCVSFMGVLPAIATVVGGSANGDRVQHCAQCHVGHCCHNRSSNPSPHHRPRVSQRHGSCSLRIDCCLKPAHRICAARPVKYCF
jgi:hypothetical protein